MNSGNTFLHSEFEDFNPSYASENQVRRPLKRTRVAVIREELVKLTGDAIMAVVLNQLLYWTQRVDDFDELLAEEAKRNAEMNVQPRYGWIYKTAEELGEETLMGLSAKTIRRHLSELVAGGWLQERSNPENAWDKTRQYRVNVSKVQRDLFVWGYALQGYPLEGTFCRSEGTKMPFRENLGFEAGSYSKGQNVGSNGQFDASKGQKRPFIISNTEITTEITAESANAREALGELMLKMWEDEVGQKGLILTPARISAFESVLREYFSSNAMEWRQFCRRVARTPFLMGKGRGGWFVTLDWILVEKNLIKVLEGNYNETPTVAETEPKDAAPKTAADLFNSIDDPLWRDAARTLCAEIGESAFVSWFDEFTFTGIHGHTATFVAPDSYRADNIRTRFSPSIANALRAHCGFEGTLEILVQNYNSHINLNGNTQALSQNFSH